MPEIVLPSFNGKEFHLSHYHGKKVVLFMWGSWCISREDLPNWQDLHKKYRNKGIEIIGVAVDAQGSFRAKPYVERAGVSFLVLVDQENQLGTLLGFKSLPSGVLVDERGLLHYMQFGNFNIQDPKVLEQVEIWFNGTNLHATTTVTKGLRGDKAISLFRDGVALYRQSKLTQATNLWRRAVDLDPKNLIIRKQLWALENPDRFYKGKIDQQWQAEQLKMGL